MRMRGFVAKGGAVEAAGMGEVVEKEGVPVEDVVSASEGRGGRGRRRGVVELKRAAGGVRLKLMARGWKFLGNAKPVAAESCARMRGPSQHFERSKSRLASIRGKLRAALFCMYTCSRRLGAKAPPKPRRRSMQTPAEPLLSCHRKHCVQRSACCTGQNR